MSFFRKTITSCTDSMETARLIIRPWQTTDLNDFFEYASQPDVGPDAGWLPIQSREDARCILNYHIKQLHNWALELREEHKLIGSIGLRPDEKRGAGAAFAIGYSLSHNYWGHGYMTEAAKRVIRYAFENLHATILACYHYPHNVRSKRVIEKCGFHYEGTLRHCSQLDNGAVFDDLCYSMTRREFENAYRQRS